MGVGESDNIQRTPSAAQNETIGTAGLAFTWHDKRRRLDADIDSNLSHLNYFHHTYSDEVIGNFLSKVRASLVPQLLYWDVSDNFGQTRLSPLAAITPANRENVNYVSTGPDLTIGALGSTELGIAGRYAKATYQKSPLDNERISGTIALVRHFTLASAISLNVLDGRIR